MPPKQDNELRTTVIKTRKDRTGFVAPISDGEGGIREQWFKLSTQGFVTCPEPGQEIIVKYNVSPGNAQYPQPTYWANEIIDPRDPGSADPYENTARAVDQQNASESPQDAPERPQNVVPAYQDRERFIQAAIDKRAVFPIAVEIVRATANEDQSRQDIIDAIIVTTDELYDGIFAPDKRFNEGTAEEVIRELHEPEPEYNG